MLVEFEFGGGFVYWLMFCPLRYAVKKSVACSSHSSTLLDIIICSEFKRDVPGPACGQMTPCWPSFTVALRPSGSREGENRRGPTGACPYRMLEKLSKESGPEDCRTGVINTASFKFDEILSSRLVLPDTMRIPNLQQVERRSQRGRGIRERG